MQWLYFMCGVCRGEYKLREDVGGAELRLGPQTGGGYDIDSFAGGMIM